MKLLSHVLFVNLSFLSFFPLAYEADFDVGNSFDQNESVDGNVMSYSALSESEKTLGSTKTLEIEFDNTPLITNVDGDHLSIQSSGVFGDTYRAEVSTTERFSSLTVSYEVDEEVESSVTYYLYNNGSEITSSAVSLDTVIF